MLNINTFFDELPATVARIYLGFSGGLDSTVLLDLIRLQGPDPILKKTTIVHVNHGLSPNAAQWTEHCRMEAEKRGFPFKIFHVNAQADRGESPEAAARFARYQTLEKIMGTTDILLTAHHQDDQVETFLLQLFRGAGVKGLAAMPMEKPFSLGKLMRPLLHFSRKQLLNYANLRQLKWIEDESNFDTSLQRNFIRHELLPLIEKKYPNVKTPLLRTQALCQESDALLTEIAGKDLEFCLLKKEPLFTIEYGKSSHHSHESGTSDSRSPLQTTHIKMPACHSPVISIAALREFSLLRRTNVLRHWIQTNGFKLPSQKKLLEIEKSVLYAGQDACPLLAWEGSEIRRYRDNLYIMQPLGKFDSSRVLSWDGQSTLELPENMGQLDKSIYQKLSIPKPDANTRISIRFRNGSEKIKFAQQEKHRDLKKMFQQWGIPTWQRNRIPLLYHDETPVAVILPPDGH